MNTTEALSLIDEVICTCGNPTHAMQRLHEYLRFVNNGLLSAVYMEAKPLTTRPDFLLVIYLLTDLGIIEHDASITGSVLTKHGKKLMKALSVAEDYRYDRLLMEETEDK